ncbi:MAG: zinc ribbon domain-containing protein [Anaerolineae bacterium]
MPDIIDAFRKKAEDVLGSINRSGGLRATIDGLRKQMAESDRKRAMSRARAEVKRLNTQVSEMITAIGLQVVGLHEAGKLTSPELEPLCQHIVELKAAVTQQEKELARLEAESEAEAAAQAKAKADAEAAAQARANVDAEAAALVKARAEVAVKTHIAPTPSANASCTKCGKPLPAGATFCAYCGAAISTPMPVAEEKHFCASCGSALRPSAKFCSKCGQTVQSPPVSP